MPFIPPKNSDQWEEQAKHQDCINTYVSDLEADFVTSASKIGKKQYLTLRALWTRTRTLDPPIPFTDKDDLCDEAAQFLDTHQAWRDYWTEFDEDILDQDKPRALAIVRTYQRDSQAKLKGDISQKELARLPAKVTPIKVHDHGSESDVSDSGEGNEEENHSAVIEEKDSMPAVITRTIDLTLETPAKQREIMAPTPQTPAAKASTAPVEDETIVNMALILFLQGLCIWHPKLCLRSSSVPCWTIKRLELKFDMERDTKELGRAKTRKNAGAKAGTIGGNQWSVKPKDVWKARTDGFLEVGNRAAMIIEVKPYVRLDCSPEVQMQETAQMVAWIKACPDDCHESDQNGVKIKKRLLISQNAQEIYIIVGEYNKEYEQYLGTRGPASQGSSIQKPVSERSFLAMRQYGPWDTTKSKAVRHAAVLLLACTLSAIPTSNNDDPFTTKDKETGKETSNTGAMREAIRDNGSILTTDLLSPYVFQFNPFASIPTPEPIGPFPNATGLTGITETTPGTFEVVAGNFKKEKNQAQPGSLRLYRVSFEQATSPTITLTGSLADIPLLNGLVALTPSIILGSDSASGAVWSIDARSGRHNKVIQDPLMSPMRPSSPNSSQLGINGLRIRKDGNTTSLYFTNTAKGILAKLEINPTSGAPVTAETTADIVATDAGAAKGVGFDDFAFDPNEGGVVYACNSRGNSISNVQLGRDPKQTIVAGNLNSTLVAEPSAAQFGRTRLDGDTLYVVTAGGAGGPINGTVRVGAQLLAIDTKRNICNGSNSSSVETGGASQNQTSNTAAFTGSAAYLKTPPLLSVLLAMTALMHYF